jgi:hypothetical protein
VSGAVRDRANWWRGRRRFSVLGVPDSGPVTEVDAVRIRAAVDGVRKAQEALEDAVAR